MHSTVHAVKDLSCCIRLNVKKHQGETPWTGKKSECHSAREIPGIRLTRATSVFEWDAFLPPASHTSHLELLICDTTCNVSVSWHALLSKCTLVSLFSCHFRGREEKYLAYRKVWKIFLGFCSRELNISLQIVKVMLKKKSLISLRPVVTFLEYVLLLLLFCFFKKCKVSRLFLSLRTSESRASLQSVKYLSKVETMLFVSEFSRTTSENGARC